MSKESWSSRFGFLMASVGFAVGLGNIWRFPYIAGENGGGAFVLIYLLFAFGIGVPILMAEILIGRRGRLSPPNAMRAVAKSEGRSERWLWVGHMNLLAAFLIELVYCVITGWVLFYLYRAITIGFTNIDRAAADAQFETILASTGTMWFWTLVGLFITGSIIYHGVAKGIEKTVNVLMPILFGLLVLLAVYNAFSSAFGEAIVWLFAPDFSEINTGVFLAALGQAFFSIGVAMAGMMTYGAYLPVDVSVTKSVVTIICIDTLIALVAGVVIFPTVFSSGLDPAEGTGLIFKTLPIAFAQMPAGHFLSVLFFSLLAVAAITSMVGFVEPLTCWAVERTGFSREKSTVLVFSVIGILSLISILSYNILSEWTLMGNTINSGLDYLSNEILLPLGGLLIAVFAGWFVSKETLQKELALRKKILFEIWHMLIRYAVPVAVAAILIVGMF